MHRLVWNKLDQTADPVVDGAEEWDESRRFKDRKRVALARSRETEEALERHVVEHGCGASITGAPAQMLWTSVSCTG